MGLFGPVTPFFLLVSPSLNGTGSGVWPTIVLGSTEMFGFIDSQLGRGLRQGWTQLNGTIFAVVDAEDSEIRLQR